jgi:hypothetical protein
MLEKGFGLGRAFLQYKTARKNELWLLEEKFGINTMQSLTIRL